MGSTRSSLAANLLLAGVSLALALLVLEGLARLAYATRGGGKGTGEQSLYLEHDPVLGWRKRPGVTVRYERREYAVDVAINSLGLRGPDRPYASDDGIFRILALGDSFIEGYSVPLEQTVAAQLESEIDGPGCPAQVLNGGTAGYSTDQEYLFYLHEGSRYSPRVVLLFFYYNDIPSNAKPRYFGSPKPLLRERDGELHVANAPVPRPKPRPAAGAAPEPQRIRGSAAWRWARERLMIGAPGAYDALAGLGLWAPFGGDDAPEQMKVYKRKRLGDVEQAWQITAKILAGLSRAASARQARFAVVYIPSRFEVSDRDWELTQLRYGFNDRWDRGLVRERLGEIAASTGFPLLDLTVALREAEGRWFSEPYFRIDGHWNATGHRVAAETIVERLRQLGWLPSCSAPRSSSS